MLCTLNEVMQIAEKRGQGLAAFNVYDFEDAQAVIWAAEKADSPVVLMTNKNAVSHMGVGILAAILLRLASDSIVPACVHLDHASDLGIIKNAISEGYTSVMFDGSQLPFDENVHITNCVLEMAKKVNVSVEAEIGAVGFSDPNIRYNPRYTTPSEAIQFYNEAHVDALAVAVGTIHRMEEQGASLQFALLKEISESVKVPLVIHGASGVTDSDLKRLVQHGARKINLGTVLRLVFGNTLRKQFEQDPDLYDRISIYPKCMESVMDKAYEKIVLLQ
jgi:fructose-bisphosphate aldolase class II